MIVKQKFASFASKNYDLPYAKSQRASMIQKTKESMTGTIQNLPQTHLHGSAFEAQRRNILSLIFSDAAQPHNQHNHRTKRQTLNFGYDFVKLRLGDKRFTPIPLSLQTLCEDAVRSLQRKVDHPLPSAEAFKNCIISIYKHGDKLEPHIDTDRPGLDKYGFCFGDDIIGVILEADRNGKFYIQEAPANSRRPHFDAARAFILPEQDGTAFLLNGEARRSPYFHGVSPVDKRRISVTFRSVELK